jgi:hypothetical protein
MKNASSSGWHRTAIQRAQILTDYRCSGLTQKAFAAQAGIGHSTLTLWLRKATAGESAVSPTFIPVPNLLPTPRATATYRLQFPRGLAVEVAPGFDAEELSALLEMVQRL